MSILLVDNNSNQNDLLIDKSAQAPDASTKKGVMVLPDIKYPLQSGWLRYPSGTYQVAHHLRPVDLTEARKLVDFSNVPTIK